MKLYGITSQFLDQMETYSATTMYLDYITRGFNSTDLVGVKITVTNSQIFIFLLYMPPDTSTAIYSDLF